MPLQLTEDISKILFCCIFLFSAFNLKVAHDIRKKNGILAKIISLTSYCVLIVFLGWREKGIDHEVYYEWYTNANYWLIENYHGSPEPLFSLLTLIARYLFNSFQLIYIFAAVVYIWGLRKFIEVYVKDSYVALFFMNISLFLYMCGLVRMSIALGIIMYAYTKIEHKYLYFILVFIASMFHYSALISVLIYFVYHSKNNITFKSVIVVYVAIIIMSWVIDKYKTVLPYAIMRYAGYFTFDFSISKLLNVVVLIPAILLWVLFKNKYAVVLKNDKGVGNILKLLGVIIIVSLSYKGLFRLTFYFYAFIALVYSKFINVMYASKQRLICMLYTTFFSILGVIYLYVMFFGSQYIAPYILPIEFNF